MALNNNKGPSSLNPMTKRAPITKIKGHSVPEGQSPNYGERSGGGRGVESKTAENGSKSGPAMF